MVASNLVLIPGAGGVGRAVFEQLRAQDVPVRVMVRREDERAAELNRLGAEVVIGDLTRPETVAAALQGVALRVFLFSLTDPAHREMLQFRSAREIHFLFNSRAISVYRSRTQI